MAVMAGSVIVHQLLVMPGAAKTSAVVVLVWARQSLIRKVSSIGVRTAGHSIAEK
jgi:hypothetical protein